MHLIRFARLLDGISQLELAKKTGIKQTVLSLFENDWKEPKEEEMAKIKKVLPSFHKAQEIFESKRGK